VPCHFVLTSKVSATFLGNISAVRESPRRENVAQGSQFSLAAFPPRRALSGAANRNFRLARSTTHKGSDYLVCGAAKARTAGRAAGPERGPCATSQARQGRQIVAHGASRGEAAVVNASSPRQRATESQWSIISVASAGALSSHGFRHGPHSASATRLMMPSGQRGKGLAIGDSGLGANSWLAPRCH